MKGLIKSLFGLFIIGFGVINFSYGVLNIPDCYRYWMYTYSCQEIGLDDDYVIGSNTFSFSDFFNFENIDSYKYIGGNFSYNAYYYMFWSGSELINFNASLWNGRKYFASPKFCVYNGTDYSGLFPYCGPHLGNEGMSSAYENFVLSFNSVYDVFKGQSVSRYYINYPNYPNSNSTPIPISVCAVYDDLGKSLCVPFLDTSDYSSQAGTLANHYEYINYVDGGSSESDILGYIDYMTNSPLGGNNGGGNNLTGNLVVYTGNYTNCEVYDGFAEIGYVESMCYSDFSIDNLASSNSGNEQFLITDIWEDGVSFTGASVFDLYRVYSGGVSMNDWLNRFNVLYYQTRNWDGGFANYYGKSKGLYYLFYKLNIHNQFDSFNYTDYVNYCRFVLSDYSCDEVYTGSLPYYVKDEIDSTIINDNNEDSDYVIFPDNSSVFYDSSVFGSGGGAGGGGGQSLDDFCSPRDVKCRFKQFVWSLTSIVRITGSSGSSGILPMYIIVGFLAFAFLYAFKR